MSQLDPPSYPELPVRGTRWFAPDGTEIRTDYEPTPALWRAFLEGYDGAPDAGPQIMGWGKTEREAVDDACEQVRERLEEQNTYPQERNDA